MREKCASKWVELLEAYGDERNYDYRKNETVTTIVLEYDFSIPRFIKQFVNGNFGEKISATLRAEFEKDDDIVTMTIFSKEMKLDYDLLTEVYTYIYPSNTTGCYILSESGDTYGLQIQLKDIETKGFDFLMDNLFHLCIVCETYFYEYGTNRI